MASLPTGGNLTIQRLGTVKHLTALLWSDNALSKDIDEPVCQPLELPDQIFMGRGWQLEFLSPTSGLTLRHNRLIKDFQLDPYFIRLHSSSIYDIGLLDSLASVFDRLHLRDRRNEGLYGYSAMAGPRQTLSAGGPPNFLYFRPVESPAEQYLLLYDERICMYERPGDDETPSFVNLYELVQVDLDEERFLYLLRQAREAAE